MLCPLHLTFSRKTLFFENLSKKTHQQWRKIALEREKLNMYVKIFQVVQNCWGFTLICLSQNFKPVRTPMVKHVSIQLLHIMWFQNSLVEKNPTCCLAVHTNSSSGPNHGRSEKLRAADNMLWVFWFAQSHGRFSPQQDIWTMHEPVVKLNSFICLSLETWRSLFVSQRWKKTTTSYASTCGGWPGLTWETVGGRRVHFTLVYQEWPSFSY